MCTFRCKKYCSRRQVELHGDSVNSPRIGKSVVYQGYERKVTEQALVKFVDEPKRNLERS